MSRKSQGSKPLEVEKMLIFCVERHRAFWERNYIYLQPEAKIETLKKQYHHL